MITHEALPEATNAWLSAGLDLPMTLQDQSEYVRIPVGGYDGGREQLLHTSDLAPVSTVIDADDLPADSLRSAAYCHAQRHVRGHSLLTEPLGRAIVFVGLKDAAEPNRDRHGDADDVRDALQELVIGAFTRRSTQVSTAIGITPQHADAMPSSLVIGVWDNGQPRDNDSFAATVRGECDPANQRRGLAPNGAMTDMQSALFIEASIVGRSTLLRLGGSILIASSTDRRFLAALVAGNKRGRALVSAAQRRTHVMGNVTALILPFGAQAA